MAFVSGSTTQRQPDVSPEKVTTGVVRAGDGTQKSPHRAGFLGRASLLGGSRGGGAQQRLEGALLCGALSMRGAVGS